jgi:hypothetical protein
MRAQRQCGQSRLAPAPATGRGGGGARGGSTLLEEEEKWWRERKGVAMEGAHFRPSARRWGMGWWGAPSGRRGSRGWGVCCPTAGGVLAGSGPRPVGMARPCHAASPNRGGWWLSSGPGNSNGRRGLSLIWFRIQIDSN